MKRYLPLLLWIVGFEAVAAFIGMAQKNDIYNWYATLTSPPLTPPNLIFPIVWTTLYALLGIVGWRISRLHDGRLMGLFGFYMLMNWAWSFIFFIGHMMFAGFVWIILMNVLTVILMINLKDKDRISMYLLVPLLVWTLFAAYLNGGYWYLNQ